MRLLLLCVGVAALVLFYAESYPPVVVSITSFPLVALYLWRLYRRGRVGPLTLVFLFVYCMPFVHALPYVWFDFDAEPPLILWGLAVNAYMVEKRIIELMAMIGGVGALGFGLGASMVASSSLTLAKAIAKGPDKLRRETLAMPEFVTWIAVSVILTWVSSPKATVFTAVYTESQTIDATWNFAATWMISYAFLMFALSDSVFEKRQSISQAKRWLIVVAMGVIVIWFQLMRGNRESLPLVVATLLTYFVWGRSLAQGSGRPVAVLRPGVTIAILCVFLASYLVGLVRFSLVGVTNVAEGASVLRDLAYGNAIRFDNAITGTWSAVLLTPLSIAGDYVYGILPLKNGQTYLDLLGSIIPGFVADWIGYTRPIDAQRGPAWEMTYGMGGTHAVVLPFMNFRMPGVFVILGVLGALTRFVEGAVLKRPTVVSLALLGSIVMALPHWLWYGEKNIINVFIIWLVLSFLYRIRLTGAAVPQLASASIPNLRANAEGARISEDHATPRGIC